MLAAAMLIVTIFEQRLSEEAPWRFVPYFVDCNTKHAIDSEIRGGVLVCFTLGTFPDSNFVP